MFYYALTFLPIGILIGLFSKKEKPIIDSLLYSSVISACIVFIISLRIIKIDVNIYEKPIKPIKYKFWSAKYYGSYLVNQLNIDPALVKTHQGLIFDKVKEENTIVYHADGRSTTNAIPIENTK